jgi:hypothetical protein
MVFAVAICSAIMAAPAGASPANKCSGPGQGAAHASANAKGMAVCRPVLVNGFVHDLATDTLTVNYDGLSAVRLFSVTMRIPGYPEYTSGVWVGANVWDPTSSNCLAMAPYCNYGMNVTWGNGQVVVQNVDASYPGSKVVQIDFYDANFNLLYTMGSMDPTPI